MTVTNIVEEIKQLYPNAGETQILKELNKAYRAFINKTKILKTTVVIDSTDDVLSFELSGNEAVLDLTTFNITAVNEIRFRDTSDEDYDVNPCEFMIDGFDLRLRYDSLLTDFTTQAGFQTIVLNGVFLCPQNHLSLADSTDDRIDDELMGGIIAKVKEFFAMLSKDIPLLTYYRALWKEALIEGMRAGNEGANGLQINVKYN